MALPPIAEAAGWRATLVFSVAVATLTAAAVQQLRSSLDAERGRHQPLSFGSFLGAQNLARPLRLLWSAPGIPRLALVGACFAIGQGCWFAFLVTYLVTELKLSLTAAGSTFALMQATGIFGRILLG